MKGCRQTDVCSQSCSTVGQETGLFFSSPENMVFSFREKKKERKKKSAQSHPKKWQQEGSEAGTTHPHAAPRMRRCLSGSQLLGDIQ